MSDDDELRGRRLRRVLAWTAVAIAVLWIVARVQRGLPPATDEAWRRHVRVHVGVPEVVRIGLGRWVRRFAVPRSAGGVCDLASTPRGLALATSVDPLARDGAAVLRWDGRRLASVVAWEGQGFLRVHAFGNTLVVPDADAPFRALPFAFDLDVDGYVFVSGPDGAMSVRSREVLPAAYHVFDVARLGDGRLVASTGAYPPSAIAYFADAAPAALFVDDGAGRPWRRILEFPSPRARGVYRFTYLLGLDGDALLAGYTSPREVGAVRITSLASGHPRVTRASGIDGYVLRWVRWGREVLAIVQGETMSLRRSRDGGASFETVSAPDGPQSAVAVGEELLLLAGGALYRSTDAVRFEEVAAAAPALGHRPSSLASAPLIAHAGTVWAGSPTTGEVFAFEAFPSVRLSGP